MSAPVKTFDAATFAVLADCHIHLGGGPAFSLAALAALEDAHLIVVLGDMGESAGLDQLEAIAPVVGVRGEDDAEDDPRTVPGGLVLKVGRHTFGCVFDAKAAGLAESSDPFTPTADIEAQAERFFGTRIDVLLHAATHKVSTDAFGDGRLALNPGSAVLPTPPGAPTFLRLDATAAVLEPEIVFVG